MNENIRHEDTNEFFNKIAQFRVKCKCGHVLILVGRPYMICSWCGRMVYRSKKDEFKAKLKKEIKK